MVRFLPAKAETRAVELIRTNTDLSWVLPQGLSWIPPQDLRVLVLGDQVRCSLLVRSSLGLDRELIGCTQMLLLE